MDIPYSAQPGEFGYETWPKDAWKYIGGTNNWGEMTIDTRRGIAYIPLGSPTYDYYGADRIGANLFGTSIVALEARTGKRLWHFRMVHHDLWDLDPNSAPQLTTIRHNGRNRDVVAVAGKTGWLYVFDRVTGEPMWPIEERPVPKSGIRVKRVGRHGRIRPNPPPFIKQTFTVEDISPYLAADEPRRSDSACWPRTTRGCSHRSVTQTPCTSRPTMGVHSWRHRRRAGHWRSLHCRARESRHPAPRASHR